jgi:hypothetical protein
MGIHEGEATALRGNGRTSNQVTCNARGAHVCLRSQSYVPPMRE